MKFHDIACQLVTTAEQGMGMSADPFPRKKVCLFSLAQHTLQLKSGVGFPDQNLCSVSPSAG